MKIDEDHYLIGVQHVFQVGVDEDVRKVTGQRYPEGGRVEAENDDREADHDRSQADDLLVSESGDPFDEGICGKSGF